MKVFSTVLLVSLSLAAAQADAQTPRTNRPTTRRTVVDTTQHLEIYGFGQGDAIFDFKTNDPNWFDVNRPSKLPSFTDEFGKNYHTWFSARQSRLGVKGEKNSEYGPMKAVFDFDLFGVGIDAGQTTIRLRHAWGQWGQFGGGQLESPFMDLDIFPNILDYWGPNGMLFFRNVQLFWQPINDKHTRATLALERPGASGDLGVAADRVELTGITPRFPAPDISAEYRYAGDNWGYVKLSGIVRWIRWDDLLVDTLDLGGGVTGWGVNLSSNLNLSKHDVLRLQAIYGAGVENYFNDAPVDVGIERNFGNRLKPVDGEALKDLGLVAYIDHRWNPQWTSALGWSMVNITNSDLQAGNAFHQGQYASVNGLYTPVPDVMMGAEFQWAYRKNAFDGFSFNDYRIQVSFKYSFSKKWGRTEDEP